MKWTFRCVACGDTLEEPGAILFGPPEIDDRQRIVTEKHHICPDCYPGAFALIETMGEIDGGSREIAT